MTDGESTRRKDGLPARAGDYDHDATIDFMVVAMGVFGDPEVGLVCDRRGQNPQGQRVEQHDQHLDTVVAISTGDSGRALSDPHCEQGKRDSDSVGEHMGRVGEQAEAAGHNAADDLNNHMRGQQAQHYQQGTFTCSAVVVSMVVTGDGGMIRSVMMCSQGDHRLAIYHCVQMGSVDPTSITVSPDDLRFNQDGRNPRRGEIITTKSSNATDATTIVGPGGRSR